LLIPTKRYFILKIFFNGLWFKLSKCIFFQKRDVLIINKMEKKEPKRKKRNFTGWNY